MKVSERPVAVRPLPPAVARDAKQVMDHWRAAWDVPGVSVSIRERGAPVLDVASGVANLRSGRELTPDDTFYAASTTKMGTAALVLQLVDQGELKLSEKVSRWFPDLPAADRISVRQLLEHRSGVPSWDRAPDTPWAGDLARGPGNAWTTERLMQFLKEQPAAFEPGDQFEYSNGNYNLLEMIVEKQTGQPFAEVFDDRLLKPAGADRARLDMGGTGGDPTTVSEYVDYGVGLGPTNHDKIYGPNSVIRSTMRGAGGLVTSAGDLARYGEAILAKDGVLLSDEARKTMLTPAGRYKVRYGLGVAQYGGDDPGWRRGPKAFGHGGDALGSVADVVHIPGTGQTIAGLANTSVGHDAMLSLFAGLRKVLSAHERAGSGD